MLCVECCLGLLFVACWLLFGAGCVLFVCCLLCARCWLPFIVARCLLFVVRCSWFAVVYDVGGCSLFCILSALLHFVMLCVFVLFVVVGCPSFVLRCLLFVVVCCLVCVAWCLLFIDIVRCGVLLCVVVRCVSVVVHGLLRLVACSRVLIVVEWFLIVVRYLFVVFPVALCWCRLFGVPYMLCCAGC